jgi:hypothetical protein
MNTGSLRWGRDRLAPFPFTSMFQNGPRRQGCAPDNLFKPAKDSPPPRTSRAALTAAGRSENLPMTRERGQLQRPNHPQLVALSCLPTVGPEPAHSGRLFSWNRKIRPPPIDDVNNLRHDDKCQRCLVSTAIQIRRNALFTSPEYTLHSERDSAKVNDQVQININMKVGAVAERVEVQANAEMVQTQQNTNGSREVPLNGRR